VDQTAAQTCTQQQPPFVVYFEWDRSDLTAANRDTINAAVARAKAGGCSITLTAVEGHTDSSGKPAYNDKLSQRRADVVKTALLGAGVADAAIKTAAKGESEPAEPRPDGTREPLNRRAEVQITIGR
jgi:outer membrane protein OmpA-like peptidoglycan-associated protein